MELPRDLPILERSAVRLVVLDIDERVLLLQIWEPLDPAQRICWELPGGGIDAGETYVDATLRELAEEPAFTSNRATSVHPLGGAR